LECFEAEERTKLVTSKNKQMNIHPDETNTLDTFPRLYRFFDTDKQTQGREHSLDKKFTLLGNKLE
jgi:hypothetical protein